jgi:hypothetical protein
MTKTLQGVVAELGQKLEEFIKKKGQLERCTFTFQ